MDMQLIMGVIYIILGLVLAFWGAKLIEAVAKIIGAIIGALIGSYIFYGFLYPYNNGDNWFREDALNETIGLIIVMIICALIGAYIAFAMLRAFVAFSLAVVVYYLCWNLLGQPPTIFESGDLNLLWLTCVIAAIITLLLVSHFFRELLAYVTAVFGGFMVGTGISNMLIAMDAYSPLMSLLVIVIMVVIAGLGAKYQLSGRISDSDGGRRPPPRRSRGGGRRRY
jgi:hypothetical protein